MGATDNQCCGNCGWLGELKGDGVLAELYCNCIPAWAEDDAYWAKVHVESGKKCLTWKAKEG